MTIPKAVSPSVLTPGLYLTVDLLAGAASPGTGELRVALLATQSSAGDLTDDTEVRLGAGESSASTAFGIGTVGHLAAKQIYGQYPTAIVDFVSPVAGAGLATLDVTAAGAPTANQVVDCDIMGRTFEVTWLVGEDADDFKDKAIAAILERTENLAVTAVTGGVGIITINFKVTGNVGNDAIVKMKLRLTQTGTETLTGAVVPTNLASGSADPDLTNALAAIAGKEYHFIVPCLSNTDVANTAASNNLDKCYTHINTYNSGLSANLQQFVAGYTGTVAAAIATTPHANSANNAEFGEVALCIAGRGLPGELGGREAGGRLAAVSIDPAANRIGEQMDEYIGALDKIADKPTVSESESAIGGGVTLITYNAQDQEVLARAVTTHSQDSTGAPDRRLLDTQNVDAAYIVSRDIRDKLPIEFPNAKITPDIPAGDDPPPKGVIEERDIKGWIISRLRFWITEAVVDGPSLDTAIADGTLIVAVDSSDATQVNIVMPYEIIQPLAKFGVVSQRKPS